MATIRINSKVKVGFEELLSGLAKLGSKDFDRFLQEVNTLKAKRIVSNLSERETELLVAVNHFWSAEKTKKYLALQKKMQEETISDKEYPVYMKMVEESEERSLKRVKNLVELAQIRRMTFPDLMDELNLNIHPLNHG